MKQAAGVVTIGNITGCLGAIRSAALIGRDQSFTMPCVVGSYHFSCLVGLEQSFQMLLPVESNISAALFGWQH